MGKVQDVEYFFPPDIPWFYETNDQINSYSYTNNKNGILFIVFFKLESMCKETSFLSLFDIW